MGELIGMKTSESKQKSYNLAKMMFVELAKFLGAKPYASIEEEGTMNTALVHHSKKTYALLEVKIPFGLKVHHAEGLEIESTGFDDFNGKLKAGISAHPKVDKRTGELHTFGYDMFGDQGAFNYSRFDKDRQLLSAIKVKLSGVRMIHDFVVTKNYAVIPDLPLEICVMDAIMNDTPFFQLKKQAPIRYGLLSRNATSEKDVTWFDFSSDESHYIFHFSNGYEIVEDGQEIVVLHGAMIKEFGSFFNLKQEHPLYDNAEEAGTLHEIRLNVTTGKHSIEPLVPEQPCDFLMINPDYMGYKNRYIFAASQG